MEKGRHIWCHKTTKVAWLVTCYVLLAGFCHPGRIKYFFVYASMYHKYKITPKYKPNTKNTKIY